MSPFLFVVHLLHGGAYTPCPYYTPERCHFSPYPLKAERGKPFIGISAHLWKGLLSLLRPFPRAVVHLLVLRSWRFCALFRCHRFQQRRGEGKCPLTYLRPRGALQPDPPHLSVPTQQETVVFAETACKKKEIPPHLTATKWPKCHLFAETPWHG